MTKILLPFILILSGCAMAQRTPLLEVTNTQSSLPGELRFYEAVVNGTNYFAIKSDSLLASNQTITLKSSSILFPAVTLGESGNRIINGYFNSFDINGSGDILTLGGSTSGSALNITGTGGGRAYSFYATQRMLAGGDGYYVTPDGFSQNVVIDASRNATLNNVTILGTCTGCGSTVLPVIDTTNIVFGSSDNTKRLRFEVDGFSSGVTNVLTPQNASYTIAGTNIGNAFSALNEFTLGSGTAINVTTSNAFNAINVQNGGVAAVNLLGTSAINSTGTINVGTSIFTLATFVDNNRNVTFNTALPITNFSGSVGSLTQRVDLYFGRFANLQSSASAAAGMRASDSSGNLKFTMGEVAGYGEVQAYDNIGAETFGVVAGNIRYGGVAGVTSTLSCGVGQAVKTITVNKGGVTAVTCGAP